VLFIINRRLLDSILKQCIIESTICTIKFPHKKSFPLISEFGTEIN